MIAQFEGDKLTTKLARKLSQTQKKAMLLAKKQNSVTLLEADYRTIAALVRMGYLYETEILREQVEEYRLTQEGEELVSLWAGHSY